jgi:hypothetical protein
LFYSKTIKGMIVSSLSFNTILLKSDFFCLFQSNPVLKNKNKIPDSKTVFVYRAGKE